MNAPEQPEQSALSPEQQAYIDESLRLMDDVYKAAQALAAHRRHHGCTRWNWATALELDLPHEDRVWLAMGRLPDLAEGVARVTRGVEVGHE